MTSTPGKSKPIACVCFGGFRQSRLESPNAFSEWYDHLAQSAVVTPVLNMTRNDESLKSRWRRLRATHLSLWTGHTDVHILGYSLGCHLAVKFAAEAAIVNRVKEILLIAPDPKFRPNILDEEESAYEEAKELWDSAGFPGDDLCRCLQSVLEKTPSSIHIIYSEDDTVATWEGNAQLMYAKCSGGNFQWWNATIRQPVENEKVWFRVKLDPSKARDEFWIHEQLFTNVRKSS